MASFSEICPFDERCITVPKEQNRLPVCKPRYVQLPSYVWASHGSTIQSGSSAIPPQVFNAANVVTIPELPQNQLEDFFAARAATCFVSGCNCIHFSFFSAIFRIAVSHLFRVKKLQNPPRFDIGARSSSTSDVSSLIAACCAISGSVFSWGHGWIVRRCKIPNEGSSQNSNIAFSLNILIHHGREKKAT